MNLAAIAVELRLSTAPLAEVAFAAELEVTTALIVRRRLEELGARLDLPSSTVQRILNQYDERARLLADAHTILKALIPYQDEIDCLVSEASRGVALLSAPGAPAIPPSRLPGTQAGAPLSSALVSRDIEQPRFHV